jgi:hypothetical protein
MYDAALLYVLEVLRVVNNDLHNMHVEQPVKLDHIYPGMKGTPDDWYYNPNSKILFVWDLKFGHGFVDEYQNPQLMIYASGILRALGIDDTEVLVHMTVVQPRCFGHNPIRTWSINASSLRPFIIQLEAAAHRAMGKEVQCVPGHHCRYCVRHVCQALQETIYMMVDVINNNVTGLQLEGDALGDELKLLNYMTNMVKFRKTAIEEQIINEIKGGKSVKNWSIKTKYGREVWKNDIDVNQVVMMGDLMGVDIRKPLALDTPTQAKAKFKKAKKDVDIIKQYSHRPETGVTLVEDNIDNVKRLLEESNNDD